MSFRSWNRPTIVTKWEQWLAMAIILVIAVIGVPHLLASRVAASQGPKVHLKQTLRTAGTEYSTLRKIYSRQSDDGILGGR